MNPRNAVDGLPIPSFEQTGTATLVVDHAPITATSGGTFTAYPGESTGTVILATFSCPDPYESASAFTAEVEWGDGVTEDATVVQEPFHTFAIEGAHTYSNAGQYTARIVLSDETLPGLDGGVRAITDALFNVVYPTPPGPPPVHADGLRFEVTEGTPVTNQLLAEFYDSDPTRINDLILGLSVTIDWGDGTTSPGTLIPVNGSTSDVTNPPSEWQIIGSHTYADKGAYLVTATVSDCYQTLATSYATALVDNAFLNGLPGDALATGTGTGEQYGLSDVGLSNVELASFSDANPLATLADFTVTIDWGDNIYDAPHEDASIYLLAPPLDITPAQVVYNDGRFVVLGSHVYCVAGSYTAEVFVQDADGLLLRIKVPITVNPASTGLPAVVNPMTQFDPNNGQWPIWDQLHYSDGSPTAKDYWSTWNDWAGWYGYGSWWIGWYFYQYAYNEIDGPIVSILQFPWPHAFGDAGANTVSADELMWPSESASISGTVDVAPAGLWTIGVKPVLVASAGVPMDPTETLLTFADDDPQVQTGDTVTIEWGDHTTSNGVVVPEVDGTFGVETGTWLQPGQSVPTGKIYLHAGVYTPIITIHDGTAETIATPQIDVGAVLSPLTGLHPGALVDLPTGPEALVTFTQTDGTALQDTAEIDWGDTSSSAGTVIVQPDTAGDAYDYEVTGAHTYGQTGTYLVTVTITDAGQQTHVVYEDMNVFGTQVQTQQLHNDPQTGQLNSADEAQFSPNTGEVQVSQPLDFDLNPGTSVGLNPALVYNSATVHVDTNVLGQAEIQVILYSSPADPVPDEIQVQFGWAGEPASAGVTFTTQGHERGDDYVFELPASLPPAKTYGRLEDERTGKWQWTAVLQFFYGLPDATPIVAQTQQTGYAEMVDQVLSPVGPGWGIAGISRLVPVCHGVLWVYGNGDWRYFAENGDGGYDSPPEDFGTLTGNIKDGWDYTAPDGTQTEFNFLGLQTAVIDPHGLTTGYGYDKEGGLTSVEAIDGGVTTLVYSPPNSPGEQLVSITEPGDRVWSFSGGMGSMTSPANQTRTISYNGDDLLIADNWDPLISDFSYDVHDLLDGYTLGGNSYTVTPAGSIGQGTPATTVNAPHPADAVGTILTPLGYPDVWSMTPAGEPLTHVRPDQREESWQRESQHEQTTLYTDWMGFTTSYQYDTLGEVTQITYPDGGTVSNAYGSVYNMPTTVTDQDTNTTAFQYDSAGDMTEMTDPDGYTTTWTWSAGLMDSMTDADGNTTVYDYDPYRRLTLQTDYDPLDNVVSQQSWQYDPAGNVDYWDDGASHVTRYVTDGVNRVTSTTDGDGFISTQTWFTSGLLETATDGRQIETDYGYDGAGMPTSTTVDAGGSNPETTTFANDPDGMQTLATDALGRVTHFFFDVDSRQVAVQDPRGFLSDTLYDDDSRVTESVDNDGNVTLSTFDAMARQLSEEVFDAGGTTLVTSHEWRYDPVGNVLVETDGDQNTTTYTYDGVYDVLTTKEYGSSGTLRHETTDVYDGDGDVVKETDGDGNYTLYTYNADGDELSDKFYDQQGNLISSEVDTDDGDGEVTDAKDGDQNQVIDQFDGDGNLTLSFELDAQNNTICWETYSYDGDGNLIFSMDGDGNITVNTYDDENNLASTSETGGSSGTLVTQTVNKYDLDNELTKTTDGDANETDYGYDADGNQTSTTLYDATALGHNLISRLSEVYDGDGNATWTQDGDNNVTTETVDADGNVLSDQFFDANGTLISEAVTKYDGNDNPTKTTDGDNNVTFDSYDDNELVEEKVTSATGRTVSDVENKYDLDGNVTWSEDGDQNITTSQFDGDQLMREVETSTAGRIVSDVQNLYDEDSNITRTADGDLNTLANTTLYAGDGSETINTFDGDQLTEAEQIDANGNVVSVVQNLYDKDGNVTLTEDGDTASLTPNSVYAGDGSETTNQYDGDQLTQAIALEQGGTIVSAMHYQYDGDGNVTKMTDGDGTVTQDNYDGDQLSEEKVTSAAHHTISDLNYLYDLDSNVTKTTDGDLNVTTDQYDGDQLTRETETSTAGRIVSDEQNLYDLDGNVTLSAEGDLNTLANTTLYAGDGTESIDSYDGDELMQEKDVSAGGRVVDDTQNLYDEDGNITLSAEGDANTLTPSSTYQGDGTETTNTYDGDELMEAQATSQGGRVVSDEQYRYDHEGNIILSADGDLNLLPGFGGSGSTGIGPGGGTGGGSGNNNNYAGDGSETFNTWLGDQLAETKLTDATGRTVSDVKYTYDDDGNVSTTTDGDNNVTMDTYRGDEMIEEQEVSGFLHKIIGDVQNLYDPAGNITLTADGDLNTLSPSIPYIGDGTETTNQYDGGELTLSLESSQHRTLVSEMQYTYDPDGNVSTSTDGDGNITTDKYDGDELTQAIEVGGAGLLGHPVSDMQYGYDEDGNVTSTEDGDGNVTTDQYDGDELTRETETSVGHRIVSDVQNMYDEDGNITRTAEGDLNTLTNSSPYAGDGSETVNSYNGDELTQALATDKNGHTDSNLQYQYDEDDNVTKTTDGDSNVTTDTYLGDEQMRETEKSANGRTVSDVQDLYDEDGNITLSAEGDLNTLTSSSAYAGDGTETTNTYDGDELIEAQATDASGRTVSDEQSMFDEEGNVTLSAEGDGNKLWNTTLYAGDGTETVDSYDGDELTEALVKSATRPSNTLPPVSDMHYVYDADGSVILTTDGDGNRTTDTYDGNELMRETEISTGGRTISDVQNLYDEDGNVTLTAEGDTNTLAPGSAYVGDGTETVNHYDGDELTETIESSQHRTLVSEMQYGYDEDGNVTWSEDGDNNVTNSQYAGDEVQTNAVTSPLDGVDSNVSYQYDGDGNVTWTKDGDANITSDQFNGDEVTQEIETSSTNRIVSNMQYAYDEDGNVTWTKDGDNNVTTDSYQGDELMEEKEVSGSTTISDVQNRYDEEGNVTLSADGDLESITSGYLGDGSLTQDHYDGGELIQETKTSGSGKQVSDMQYGYDEDGNVTLTIDGDDTRTDLNYDADYTATTDTIDGDQVMTEVVSGANGEVSDTSYGYDLDGNVTSTTVGAGDPNVNGGAGDTTFNKYDGDELMSTTDGYSSSETAVTQYTYDGAGNVASERDPDGNTTNYTTDANGNTVTMTTPLGTTSYQYDQDGNEISAIDPLGRKITSQYDGNELVGEVWYNADGSTQNTLSFTYDAAGNLLSATNNAGTDTFTYAGDQLASQTDTNGLTLTYGYDEDGNITSVTDSQGATEAWTYDGDEVSTQTYQDGIYQLSIGFTYDENGNLTSEKRYSDLAGTQLVGMTTYSDPGDEQGTILQTDGAGNTLASYIYGWDLAGQLTSKTENGTSTSYTYDPLGQLTDAGSQTYSYDANGNPNGNGETVGGDNEVSSDGTWNYIYSAAGDVTSQTDPSAGLTWTYTYDDANELTSATETNSMGFVVASASYAYDAFGNRISTSDVQNGMNTVTLSSYEAMAAPRISTDLTSWHLWADLATSYGGGTGGGGLTGPQQGSGTNVVQTRYFSGAQPDQWFARVDIGAGVRWDLTDYQGSIRQITDSTGTVIDTIAYDPYGAITTETAPGLTGRIGLDGYQFDVITHWYHAARRDEDPATDEWTEDDPLQLLAGPNPHAYLSAAPTAGADPSGLLGPQAQSSTSDPSQGGSRYTPPAAGASSGGEFLASITPSQKPGGEVVLKLAVKGNDASNQASGQAGTNSAAKLSPREALLEEAIAFYRKKRLEPGDLAKQIRLIAEVREAWLGRQVDKDNAVIARRIRTDAEAAKYIFFNGKLEFRAQVANRLEESSYRQQQMMDAMSLKPSAGSDPIAALRALTADLTKKTADDTQRQETGLSVLLKEGPPELGAFIGVKGGRPVDVLADTVNDIKDALRGEEERQSLMDILTRAVGVLKMVGGVAEGVIATKLLISPETGFLGAMGAGAVYAHSASTFENGWNDLLTGKPSRSRYSRELADVLKTFKVDPALADTLGEAGDVLGPEGIYMSGQIAIRGGTAALRLGGRAVVVTGRAIGTALPEITSELQGLLNAVPRGSASVRRALGNLESAWVTGVGPAAGRVAVQATEAEVESIVRSVPMHYAPAPGASITPYKSGTKLDLTGPSVGFTKQTYSKGSGYVYVLWDKKTGEVLKVGKTSGGVNIYTRFNMYRRKSQEFGYKVELEFWEAGTERNALDLEGQIRTQLKAEGHILSWDKTANPGRNDLGLPWDRSGSTSFEIEN